MGYEEFRRHLGKAGLTVREFAALMQLNTNSISNYASTDRVPSHHAVAVALMSELAEHKLDFRAVINRLEVRPKRVRGGASLGRFAGSRQTDLHLE